MAAISEHFLDNIKNANDITTTSFERELNQILRLLKDGSKFKQTSNYLFALLNKYELKLDPIYYKKRLVELGDSLRNAAEFSLAISQGYGRYLQGVGVAWPSVDDLFHKSDQRVTTELNLRSVIGTCLCSYELVINKDSRLTLPNNRSLCILLLHNLKPCIQTALQTESHYWILYNAITLCYSISRLLMSVNLVEHVIEPLLWSCVSMESCVPLMAGRYLSLRGLVYTAVCQCYYAIDHPMEAELFARRGLEKVHQLAQIHSQADSAIASLYSENFSEVTIKLCVMIFKRSVLESHKKTRSILRPKVRPTLKELLQNSWPRSPTEKLLDEMFTGSAAKFLAVTECLFDSKTHPLEKATPHPVTELDNDTVTDVYQELFTAGVDLACKGLQYLESVCEGEEEEGSDSLMELAVKGSNTIPLSSLIRFVHVLYNCDCTEGVTILTPLIGQYCSNDSNTTTHYSLSILTACDDLRDYTRKVTILEDKEVWTKCQLLLHLLHSSLNDHTLSVDLVTSAAVLIWEGCGPLYNSVVSSEASSNAGRALLTTSRKYVVTLDQLLTVFRKVDLVCNDPVLYSKVLMKYVLLLEMESDLYHQPRQSSAKKTTTEPQFNPFIKYDRAKLLHCQGALQEGLLDLFRGREKLTNHVIPETREMLKVIQAELVYIDIRVAVKLSSTIPPKSPFQEPAKPSTLPLKIEKREHEKTLWKKMVSSVTAPDANIPSEQELLNECNSDKFRSAVLLMTIVAYTDPSNDEEKERMYKLLKRAYNQLLALISHRPPGGSGLDTYPGVPPPPILSHRSSTSMSFRPSPFQSNEPVLYYALYGRKASGSNVKVRLNDCHYSGLGIEVPADDDCVLSVTGLQPHVDYVFAVAAIGAGGKLIGPSPGLPTPPILASNPICHEMGCGLLCQYSYKTKNYSIAIKSANILWKKFVYPLTTDEAGAIPNYRLRPETLSSTPTPLIRVFGTSILTSVHSHIVNMHICPDATMAIDTPLLPSQRDRLKLVGRLRVGLEVFGWLNDHTHCLQVIVMCYMLLVPFLQQNIVIKPITDTLLQFLSVLETLPDSVLVSRHNHVVSGVHHMIAVIGYSLVEILSSTGQKHLLPVVADICRSKLILTLPTPSLFTQDTPKRSGGLQDPSLSSTLSTMMTSRSYSVFGASSSLLPLHPGSGGKVGKQKKKRKKTLNLGETIAEELKSPQFKAIQGYFICKAGTVTLDDLDLTGQEDPALLHVAINNMSIQAAYKEVVKFKRRPQYLEYFVHLASAALSQWKGDMILDWSCDVFAWIKKRNEIILSAKHPQVQKVEIKDGGSQKAVHPQQTPGDSYNHQALQTTTSNTGLPTNNPNRKSATPNAVTRAKGTGSRLMSRDVSLRTSTRLGTGGKEGRTSTALQRRKVGVASRGRVTRDDLKLKSFSALQNLLPKVWRVSRCRKKFRIVSSEEQPWRAQINLFLGSCVLQGILDRMQETTPTESDVIPLDWFRFDVCGKLIEWVVPPVKADAHNPSTVASTPELHPHYNAAVIEQELKKLMCYVQRGIVLADRAGCWVLAVNGCRLLWNALAIIRHYIHQQNSQGFSAAELYGIALQCLYMGADTMIDVYKFVQECTNEEQVSLSMAALLCDDSFLHQFLLLSLNVCYTNQHWEKVLTLEQKMINTIRTPLQDWLKPMVTDARTRLLDRIQTHSSSIVRESVHPAAHLDIRSYNLYGTTGFSLGMSALPLATPPDSTHLSTSTGGGGGGGEALKRSRCLYAEYLSSRAGVGEDASFDSVPTISDVEHIVDSYKEALDILKKEGDRNSCDLQLQAMHELGNILYFMDDQKSAYKWWLTGLKSLLHCKDPLSQWRSLDLFKHDTLELLGVWGCILGGILASKLARFVFHNELDIRLEYYHMASTLFKLIFQFSMPHPLRDIDHAHYTLPTSHSLHMGPDLFTDQFRCSLSLFITSLHDTVKELINRCHVLKVLPLITLYEHASNKLARSIHHTVLARVYRSEALIQMALYGDAYQVIKGLMMGADLPVLSSEYSSQPDTGCIAFRDYLPLDNFKNMKALSFIIERTLSIKLREAYGALPVMELLMAKSHLLVHLADSCPGIPQDFPARNHDNKPVSLSSLSSQGSFSKSLSTSAGLGKFRVNPDTDVSKENVKMVLLEHAERILAELMQETDTISIIVRGYILLAKIALSLSNNSFAVNLALSGIRLLQDNNHTHSSPAHPDTLLWLQTRAVLADSLTLLAIPPHSSLNMSEICEEGVKEAQATGDLEIAAQFLYSSGVYQYLSIEPVDLGRVRCDVTQCLQTLGRVVELSQSGHQLECRASLLLAEVSMGGDATPMIGVYRGVGRMLDEQLSQQLPSSSPALPPVSPAHPLQSTRNIYKPQLKLKLVCDLRLAYLLLNVDPSHSESILKEGIKLLQSIHSHCTDDLLYNEYLQKIATMTSTTNIDENGGLVSFLKAITSSTSMGMDYLKTHQLYSHLCETLVAISNKATPILVSNSPSCSESRRLSVGSRNMPRKMSSDRSRSSSVTSGSDNKLAMKEEYQAWCALRLANVVIERFEALAQLSSELRDGDISSAIPSTLLTRVPDCVLLELAPPTIITRQLINDAKPLPLDMLLPLNRPQSADGLTWFTLIGHYQKLLRKCFKVSPLGTTHCLADMVLPQTKVLLEFLSNHCGSFRIKCSFPKIPASLCTLWSADPSVKDTPTGATPVNATPISATPTEVPPYLRSEEGEVCIMWYQVDEKRLKGFVSFNHKAIKTIYSVSSSSPFMKYSGVEVFPVTADSGELDQLRYEWAELAVKCDKFVSEQMTRPLSRSPSRMKKKAIELAKKGIPQDLQDNIHKSIEKLLRVFSLPEDSSILATPQSIASIARTLKATKLTPEKGDAYLFFKQVFNKGSTDSQTVISTSTNTPKT